MMVTWTQVKATVEATVERLDDIIERFLALKLAMGLWGAVAVPTFLVWLIEQKNTIRAADMLFLIIGDASVFFVWATLTVFFHIRKKRVEKSESDR
jgi:hypothetical protein